MKSIETRLTTAIVLGSLLILGIGSGVFYVSARAVLLREFDAEIKTRAQALAALTTEENDRIVFKISRDMIGDYQSGDQASYYQLWLADESTLARSPSLGNVDLPLDAGSMQSPEFWDFVLPNGEPGRAIGVEFIPELEDASPIQAGESGAPVTLVVASSLENIAHTLTAFRNLLMILGTIMLVAMIVMIRVAIRRGLAPLAEVTDRAGQIDALSLGQRFAVQKMPIELLPICERLNDLLARLEDSFTRERQFTADAAHELRTPIAELRSLSEVSLKWPDDAEATSLAFQDALQIAFKMETIILRLLALARSESGRQLIVLTEVSVAEMVEETWRPFSDRAAENRLVVLREVPPELHLRTDRTLLEAILANLFSNAVEYTPAGGTVQIRVDPDHSWLRLAVSNSVDHLTTDDLPNLFERFWRKDAVRTPSEHTGLGLALCKAFAELLGYLLTAELTGTTLTLTLQCPAADPVPPREMVQSLRPDHH
jgi:two-component system sensor histidine kinase QseC